MKTQQRRIGLNKIRQRKTKILAGFAIAVAISILVIWLKSRFHPLKDPNSLSSENTISQGSRAHSPTPVDEYAVYSALLRDSWYTDENTKEVIIAEQTSSPTLAAGDIPELDQETAVSFNQKVGMGENHKLACMFDIQAKCVLLNKEGQTKAFRKGWAGFYAEHQQSKGLITLSNVGFNSDLTQALVHVGISCGGLCGHECFVLLEKKEGNWSVKQKRITVMSRSLPSNNPFQRRPRLQFLIVP